MCFYHRTSHSLFCSSNIAQIWSLQLNLLSFTYFGFVVYSAGLTLAKICDDVGVFVEYLRFLFLQIKNLKPLQWQERDMGGKWTPFLVNPLISTSFSLFLRGEYPEHRARKKKLTFPCWCSEVPGLGCTLSRRNEPPQRKCVLPLFSMYGGKEKAWRTSAVCRGLG